MYVQSVIIHYITVSRVYAIADSVRNQENIQKSPDPFPHNRWGLGMRLGIINLVVMRLKNGLKI